MPTKTKHMARKASLSDTAPLAKQIKQESKSVDMSEEMKVILDTTKVEEATKALNRIPKKDNATNEFEDALSGNADQVGK